MKNIENSFEPNFSKGTQKLSC